ncbi:hypothetical protein SAMN05414138_10210 [Rhodoplanes sp. JGI PP 4-B12]|nr:hypothetical protein SAMN05414138_10210 [Rhodoplanes sp. JGI PP 4-B12]
MRMRAKERAFAVGSEDTADVAGLPRGYIQWLLGPNPRRRVGMFSLGPLLTILGVKLVMVEDPEAIALVGDRLPKRNESSVRSGAVHVELTRRFLKKIGKKGGANSRKNLTPRQASELGRRAAIARWQTTRGRVT